MKQLSKFYVLFINSIYDYTFSCPAISLTTSTDLRCLVVTLIIITGMYIYILFTGSGQQREIVVAM